MGAVSMTLEDVIEGAVGRAVSRSVTELRGEIAALRRSLPPQLGSVAEAAKAQGVSVRTVWRQIRAGQIASKKVGRKTVVDLASLHPGLVEDDQS
jgi:excisionase family DNA binding protein